MLEPILFLKVLEDKVNLDKNYKLNIKKADEIIKLEKKCQLYEKQIYEMEVIRCSTIY